MATNGNKSGFQLNMARLIALSLKKLNYLQLYSEGYLLEKNYSRFCKVSVQEEILP